MVTALDTNVLVDLLAADNESDQRRAQLVILKAAQRGPLVICPVVYAELGAHPLSTAEERDRFLSDVRISIDWKLGESIWRLAAVTFGEYAARRRRNASTEPRRLIADFIIGAHAAKCGCLATRDAAFYRRAFPEIAIIGS